MQTSRKEKLLKRLLSKPKDFTFDDLTTLLAGLGYVAYNKGKTSGSRIQFIDKSTGHTITMHKPHSKNILKI